jgi:hypothetical protein
VLWAVWSGVLISVGKAILLSSFLFGTGILSQEVKWPGQEANLSPVINVEVKKGCTYTFLPLHAFMVCTE